MRLSALILVSISLTALPQQLEINAEPLSESVLVLTGGGGNVTAVVGREGVVVVDTFTSPAAARLAKEKISEFSHKPVRYVINTHYHADHTFGNQVFADAAIIAHSNCASRVAEAYAERAAEYAAAPARVRQLEADFRDAVESDADKAARIKEELDRERRLAALYEGMELVPAPLTIDGGMTINLGDKKLKLLHFGPGHTDGDLVVFVPEDNLLITGDLVFHHSIPYIDVGAGADVQAWIGVLEKLYEMCDRDTKVIVGHGDTGGRQALADQRDYLRDLWKAVDDARTSGKTLDEAKAELKLEKYSHYERYERALAGNVEACWQLIEKSEAGSQ
ncbi:MAG TPA: MBL fold metallo-hydrolase [Acidobacteriota bacterium]|nr:MBL fold metallo-hydrolase [Acidobacteriota bacterium]